MRLAVLDIGSNSAHLRVVDAYPGSPPLPLFRHKEPTHLAQCVDRRGALRPEGIDRVVRAVRDALDGARDQQVAELIPIATAAIRDAVNRDEILDVVEQRTGVRVGFLTGEEEARLTYFAAHRWYGWSTGPLLLIDIGGGSMEVVAGRDEDPSFVVSLPLGAGRLTRLHLPDHPATGRQVKALRRHVKELLAAPAQRLAQEPAPGRVVGTSKTLKQLARLAGTTVVGRSREVRVLRRDDLRRWIPRLASMSPGERRCLSGVAPERARQILAGAVAAEAAMRVLAVDSLDICPWALREGVLLRRLSPLLTPDSLRQIKMLRAAADGDVALLDGHRGARGRASR
jgi:exopolyphosphatase / guanosine-5'-triphosphate,3'-diphosphate pyrophosphatase